MTWKTDTPLGSGTTRPGTTIESHIMMKCRLCSPSSWSTLRLPSPAPSPPATCKTCPALLFSVSLSTSRSPRGSSRSRGVCDSSVKKGMLEPHQYDFLLGLFCVEFAWFASLRAPAGPLSRPRADTRLSVPSAFVTLMAWATSFLLNLYLWGQWYVCSNCRSYRAPQSKLTNRRKKTLNQNWLLWGAKFSHRKALDPV